MKHYAFLFLGFLSSVVWTQESYEIRYINEKIEVDGKLEEKIWDELPTYTSFHNYLPDDVGLAKNQTEVKLFHNGEFLFISAVYKDSTNKIQISSLKRDDIGNTVAGSETFVFIMDTQLQQQSAYYFAINIGGAQVDGLVERVNDGFSLSSNWNTVWKASTFVNNTDKQYELAIPLKNLSFDRNNKAIAVQMYVRDIKNNSWTIITDLSRNYRLFDLRFTKRFAIDSLPRTTAARFALTPSLTLNHQKNTSDVTTETTFIPSLDVQYNLSSSLKLDAAINPDFSQIDVDQQVTNLTRFSIFFPEQRNFFLENADLFSNLGQPDVNPFYSRRIGAETDMQFGVKVSGNVAPKTRIGLLNAQTKKENGLSAQNYGVLVGEQQLSPQLTATGFLVNRQATKDFVFTDDYNRTTGLNVNYKSLDGKWTGIVNLASSFTPNENADNLFYNLGAFYNARGTSLGGSIRQVQRNYLAEVGFTPRLFNFDAEQEVTVREGYTQSSFEGVLTKFLENSEKVNAYRYFFGTNDSFWDEEGKLQQSTSFYNTALIFQSFSAVYLNLYHDYVNLKYSFDPLNNGNPLLPNEYQFFRARAGYNSVRNTKFVYNTFFQYGEFYSGLNTTFGLTINYRLLPFANLLASYQMDNLNLNELGQRTFHLARFTGEVFFNNRLNWTTFIQYSSQNQNLNINSRLQWEYKPLSFIYLVITDNFNEQLQRTNWGVAMKVNYRFDF